MTRPWWLRSAPATDEVADTVAAIHADPELLAGPYLRPRRLAVPPARLGYCAACGLRTLTGS